MNASGEDPFGWVGATLDGKYQVDAVVGRGGFGVVYRAHHLGFDQKVALKCLRIPQSLTGAARDEFERTFLAEGRLLHQLSRGTAGIVQALDVGALVSPNKTWTPFIVLEWLDGETLEENLSARRRAGAGGRTVQEAVDLLDSAARALALAHEQGIAHRDIKPANLFLAEVGGRTTLKVLDFGIAKVVSESESISKAFEQTGTSLQAFTARYGAPEQFSRRYGATGPWSDVFSLALVLVEAVIGRSALDGTDAAQLFIAAADTSRRPTLRTHGVPTSSAVEAVLSTALAVDPKQRYANAGLFWDALALGLREPVEALDNASSGRPGAQPALFDPESVTRSDALPEAVARAGTTESPATELTASTALPAAHAAPKANASPGRRRVRWVAVALLSILGLGLALWRGRAPTFTAEGVRAKEIQAARVSPSVAGSPGNGVSPLASAESAPPVSWGFAGVPARDVPAGAVPRTGSWLDKFSVLRREGSGIDLKQAAASCLDAGKSLCTDSQWQRACDTFPELAQASSWTDSLEEGQAVVRGGGSCFARKLVATSNRDRRRIGLCCDRSVAVSSSTLQKSFLSSTAAIVLRLETALNQRNVAHFLALSEDHVLLDQRSRDQTALKALLSSSFAAAPDLVIVNDHCEISVSAKKVVQKRPRRPKKTSYETTGWTAACVQTRHRDGKTLSAKSEYEFSAVSKLRAVNDSESVSE